MSDDDLRIRAGVVRGPSFTFRFDGRDIAAHEGESVAAALWAAGVRTWPRAVALAPPARAIFCAMGVCQECVVYVDGRAVTGCQTPVREGLAVTLLKESL